MRNINRGMYTHCSGMRQAAGSGLKRANTGMKWVQMLENPDKTRSISTFHHDICVRLSSWAQSCARLCAYCMCAWTLCTCLHLNQFYSYLSVVCRAMLWRSFSSLALVFRHFSSSVSFLTACSAFQRLSRSWSRSSTMAWNTQKEVNK